MHDEYSEKFLQERLDIVGDFLTNTEAKMGFSGYTEVMTVLDAYVTDGTKTIEEAIGESQRILDTRRKEQFIGQ